MDNVRNVTGCPAAGLDPDELGKGRHHIERRDRSIHASGRKPRRRDHQRHGEVDRDRIGELGAARPAVAGLSEAPMIGRDADIARVSEITRNIYRQGTAKGVLSVSVNEIGRTWKASRCVAGLCIPGKPPSAALEWCTPGVKTSDVGSVVKLISEATQMTASGAPVALEEWCAYLGELTGRTDIDMINLSHEAQKVKNATSFEANALRVFAAAAALEAAPRSSRHDAQGSAPPPPGAPRPGR